MPILIIAVFVLGFVGGCASAYHAPLLGLSDKYEEAVDQKNRLLEENKVLSDRLEARIEGVRRLYD